MVAELLPSSRVTIFMPASLAIWRPTGGLPVKLTMLVRSSITSLLPIVAPEPTTTWRTPSGRPAAARSSASRSAVSGVLEAGFSTTALPPASAGATLCATRLSGKLNGEIAAMTPRGSRIVQPKRFSPLGSASISMSSPAVRLASSFAQRKVLAPRLASTRASLSGLPPSAAMRRATCSALSSIRCEVRSRIAARFQAGNQRYASAAARARSRTTSMSASVAVGISASSAPSHGARSTMGSSVPYDPRIVRPGWMRSLTRTSTFGFIVRTSRLPWMRSLRRGRACEGSIPGAGDARTKPGATGVERRGAAAERAAAPVTRSEARLAVLAERQPGLVGLALVSAEGAPVAQRHDVAPAGDVLALAALIHAHRLVGEVDVDLLDLGVLVEAVGAELAAHAALLVAAPRGLAVGRVVGVDPGDAGAQRLDHAHGFGDVLRPDGARQAVDGVVCDRDGFLLALERDHDQHGPEDLLLGDAHRVVDVHEDRGLVVVAVALQAMPAGGERGAFVAADLHVLLDGRELLLVDQRAHLAVLVERRAHLDRHGPAYELSDEAVVDGALHDEARAGRAHLTRAGEDADERAVDGGVEVGVGEHDIGALAAQLQADLLHVLGAPAHDVLANLAGAGERHHVDERRGGKIVADLAAGPGDHLEDALGKANLLEDLRQFEIGQRADGGRLEDHHVTGRQRRRDLPGGHEHRVVPRRDADGDADRLAHDHAHGLAGHFQRLAVRLDHEAGVVVERVGRVAHVDDRLGEELAHLVALQAGELVGALADPGGGPSQDLAALHRLHPRPGTFVERLARRLDGCLRVGDGRLGYAGDHLFGGGVEDLRGLAVRRVDQVTADVHLVGSHVRCLDYSHCAHLSWAPAMHAGKGKARGKTGLVPSRARDDSYQGHSHWDWRNNTSSVGITGEGVAACGRPSRPLG